MALKERNTETLLDAADAPAKPKRRTDPTLALASRMDRTLETLPEYGRVMVLNWLCSKWLPAK